MERFCGRLQPAIRSRRFPYACIAQYVVDDARLSQIRFMHNMSDEIQLDHPWHGVPGQLCHSSCRFIYSTRSLLTAHTMPDDFCVLLPPRCSESQEMFTSKILAALATRFDTTVPIIRPLVANMKIDSFGKVRFTDGDTMVASSLSKRRDDTRDASFIRVRTVPLISDRYYLANFNSMRF